MKQILIATLLTFFLLLTSFDNFLVSEEKDGVYLDYLGKGDNNQEVVQFRLVNNSSEAIKYWGYSVNSPFCSYQVKNDTGWTNNLRGWCGTGAKAYELQTGSSIDFRSSKPNSLSVWRLTFEYNIRDSKEWETVYSSPIQN